MAQVILSGDELACILMANGIVPPEVSDLEINGENIKVKVATPWPVVKSVRVRMRFIGFENGQAVLQLTTNRLVDAFDWLVDRVLESFPLDKFAGRWEYPRLYVDVNRLLRRQVRGTEITNVVVQDGHFRITTIHVAEAEPCQHEASEAAPPGEKASRGLPSGSLRHCEDQD